MSKEIQDAIKAIVKKSQQANDSSDALRFSQAVLNLAHAEQMLREVK